MGTGDADGEADAPWWASVWESFSSWAFCNRATPDIFRIRALADPPVVYRVGPDPGSYRCGRYYRHDQHGCRDSLANFVARETAVRVGTALGGLCPFDPADLFYSDRAGCRSLVGQPKADQDHWLAMMSLPP